MSAQTPSRHGGLLLVARPAILLAIGVLPLLWAAHRVAGIGSESLERGQRELQFEVVRGVALQAAGHRAAIHAEVKGLAQAIRMAVAGEAFQGWLSRVGGGRGLATYVENSPNLVYVSVVDSAGVGHAAGSDLGGDARLVEHLRAAVERGREGSGTVSAPTVSTSLEEPVVVVGEPVTLGGKVEGIVLAVASLRRIQESAAANGRGGLFEVYVVDGEGHLIAHSDPSAPLLADMSSVEVVRLLKLSKGEGGVTPFTMAGKDGPWRMIGAFVPLPDDSRWGVVVQAEEENAYFAANDLRRKSKLVMAVMTALALVLGGIFVWQVLSRRPDCT